MTPKIFFQKIIFKIKKKKKIISKNHFQNVLDKT